MHDDPKHQIVHLMSLRESISQERLPCLCMQDGRPAPEDVAETRVFDTKSILRYLDGSHKDGVRFLELVLYGKGVQIPQDEEIKQLIQVLSARHSDSRKQINSQTAPEVRRQQQVGIYRHSVNGRFDALNGKAHTHRHCTNNCYGTCLRKRSALPERVPAR